MAVDLLKERKWLGRHAVPPSGLAQEFMKGANRI
jgi:hypothetical protein